jgi:hypothetical protein
MTYFEQQNPQIAGELSETQTARALAQAQAIAVAAEPVAIKKEQFVFFAAFDGTRNDKKDIDLSGNPEDTNVAQLYTQAFIASKTNANLRTGYYGGHGTDGTVRFSEALPIQVTKEAVRTAKQAYNEFAEQASEWLETHPNGDVTTAIASFSRGGGTAAVFTQLLYKNGLIDPETKEQLIPPGQIEVSAGVIFDPVTTGQDGNVAFAPNVKNMVIIRAENEYRYLFKAVDYAGQPGIKIIDVTGNHCNIGGGYQKDALGDLYLGTATEFLQKSGLNIADVDPSRRYEAGTKLVVYNESGLTLEQAQSFFSEYKTRGQWDVYSYFDPNTETQAKRLLDKVTQPAQLIQAEEGIQQKTFKLYNGQKMIESQNFGEKARIYLENHPEKAVSRHPDLLGAFILRDITLINIADMPTETQQKVLAQFDMNVIANIEQGKLPHAPQINLTINHDQLIHQKWDLDLPSMA